MKHSNLIVWTKLKFRNNAFLVTLNNIRTIQVNHMSVHYPIIGVVRVIYHFSGVLYMNIGEKVGVRVNTQ